MDDLDLLNPQQRKAVEEIHGRVLVLAGAGSGKTRVLTTRMAYLIRTHHVPPESILGLTFTNKAASEMRHRLAALVSKQEAKKVTLCTFHSFCMQILRQEIHHLGYTSSFTLYDEQDVKRLINAIARDILGIEGELPSLGPTIQALRDVGNKGEGAEAIAGTSSDWHDDFAKQVFERLKASMRAYNAVDFDHLLSLTVELFETFPAILEKYQERYRYIMIDEYQDTNPVQYKLASLLSEKYRHLCVVGDDDQSIYGWRGAEIENILNFDQALVIKLEQNYRSTNAILKAANAVIGRNQTRHQKELWSDKGEGNLIEIFSAPTDVEEAQAVVARLIKMRQEYNLAWKDFAILYRSNSLSRQLEVALMKGTWKKANNQWVLGIPYTIWGSVEFYERREVKDLLAYLRVIVNPLDQESLLRIINQPRRGIGDESLDRLTAYNRQKGVPLWNVLIDSCQNPEIASSIHLNPKAKKGVEDFLSLMAEAKSRFVSGALADALNWLINQINYKKAIHEEVKSQQMRDFKWENVQEFVSSIEEFDRVHREAEDQGDPLVHFTAGLALDQLALQRAKNDEDKVNLMTIHSAKGLEFPVCFLVGVEDHILPHEKCGKNIEEERRLMYVAVTRARTHLCISFACQRLQMGKPAASRPSRFMHEIPKELIRLTNHKVF